MKRRTSHRDRSKSTEYKSTQIDVKIESDKGKRKKRTKIFDLQKHSRPNSPEQIYSRSKSRTKTRTDIKLKNPVVSSLDKKENLKNKAIGETSWG